MKKTIKQKKEKAAAQTIAIIVLALLLCFAGSSCSRMTLCQHIQTNLVGYK